MPVDPLSEVLSILKPRGYMSGGIDAGGDWSFQFDEDGYFRCFAFSAGRCWLAMEGVEEPVKLEAGDFVVLPQGRAFRLARELASKPVPIMSVIRAPLNGEILCWNGGGDCMAVSALFRFAAEDATVLLNVLPPVVHIRREQDRAAMRWYLERMMQVIREPAPGGVLLGEYLAQMMLIEVLRLHVAEAAGEGAGWLSALADRQIGAAIALMHEAPGARWTLQKLAERVGMSRSAFALRFKEKVGSSAMEYLTRWRMLRAGERLADSQEPVSAIALSLGYESESAFCYAFRREMGCSPRQYGRSRRAAASAG